MPNFIKIFTVLSLFSALAFAQKQIPAEAVTVINSYIENYCHYVSDLSLENSQSSSAIIGVYPGYIDSIKKIDVELTLTYGNDDYLFEDVQKLTLENTTGNYRIVSASGPCQTIIKQD